MSFCTYSYDSSRLASFDTRAFCDSDWYPCLHRLAICVSALCSVLLLLQVDTVCRVLEMQIIILTLLENFEFSLPPQNEKTKIRHRPCQIMLPQADGEKGVWMGLHIKSVN